MYNTIMSEWLRSKSKGKSSITNASSYTDTGSHKIAEKLLPFDKYTAIT